jgi:hypothetical protein
MGWQAAIPITLARKRSASAAVTARTALLGWSGSKRTINVEYVTGVFPSEQALAPASRSMVRVFAARDIDRRQ